jgi:hypothetical protein
MACVRRDSATLLSNVFSVRTATIVVPNGLDRIPGNSNATEASDVRVQWFYAASQFPSAPILIDGVAYRLDEIYGKPFAYTNPSISVTLSTSKNPFAAISLTFADNAGSDAATVRSGPAVYGSSSGSGSPRAFDILFIFDIPFRYDPLLGLPLLVDVRSTGSFTGGFEIVWDFQYPTDVVRSVSQFGVNSTGGDIIVAQAFITQFLYRVVPEPEQPAARACREDTFCFR